VSVFLSASFPTEKSTFLQKEFWGMCPNLKFLVCQEEKKNRESIKSGMNFYFNFLLQIFELLVIKNKPRRQWVNFWSSWKRTHKMSGYNQQGVIILSVLDSSWKS
jgi:ribosomal protein L23